MTLTQAFEELTNSAEFKEAAKAKDSAGGRYRVYLSRFRAGTLKTGAMAELLEGHGWIISANRAKRPAKK